MTVSKRLTQKVGPAPLWAWLVVGLAGSYLVYRHFRSPSATLSSTPAAATTGVAGDTGATGAASGSPLDQSGGDLLSSLLDNGNAYQQLLAALQGGIGSGGSGGAVGGVPASPGGGTSGTTAPTVVDTGVTATTATPDTSGAPTTTINGVTYAGQPGQALIPTSPDTTNMSQADAIAAQQAYQQALVQHTEQLNNPPDALSRYIANQQAPAVTTVASPTPTLVAPAPVDTGSYSQGSGYTTYTQKPTVGNPVAV